MKKNDVIVIGELNIDFILNQIAALPQVGKEIISRQMTLTLGSSSAIFASNLSTLGAAVAYMGKLGHDAFGDFIIDALHAKGIDTAGIIRQPELHTGATVVLNYGEDRAMITHPGAMETLSAADIDWALAGQSKHLHISSYFIQPSLRKDVTLIFQRARQMGLTTSFDPQWDPEEKWDINLHDILPHVDVFLPNEKELLNITGSSNIHQALEKLEGIANIIAIKQGNKGSTCFSQGRSISQPAYLNPEVVDAIGAGDSFNAGFIYQFIKKESLETCQRFGNIIAALSTTAPGGTAAFSKRQDVFKIIKERYGYEENYPEK